MKRDRHESRQAVALRYQPKYDRAPKLVAEGRGYLADKILELAQRYSIPVRRDRNLLQVLSRLDLNQEIPQEVYKAVAEILAFIYRLSSRRPTK
jgi:flagellar biosynthesis protein